MKKIRVVIADNNIEYLKHLATFIRTSNEASMFIATFFSNKRNLELYILKEKAVDILLISPQLINDQLNIDSNTTVILLDDDELINDKDEGMYPSVFRYQRLNQLISDIMAIYYEQNKTAGRLLARSKQTKVIASYSPIGGSGKTTIAMNICRQLAVNDARVFYLNLELFNTTSLFFTSDEDNPSLQIFYYVKTAAEDLHAKVESLKKYDPYSMVEYFDLEISPEEMLEINESEIERLINSIVATGAYDYVVVDLDSSLHERNIAVLKECDQILWPIVNDHISILKTKSFFDQSEIIENMNTIQDKLLILLNKYTDMSVDGIEELGVPIDGYLPLISSWSTVHSNSEILQQDEFIQAIQTVIRERLLLVEEVKAIDG